MKFDSPLFDRIRVKPEKDRRPKTGGPGCEWHGCKEKATHRAPKGRGREKDYWRFCLDHVREYNQSYNFFAGMSDAAVMAYQKDALTGHRPTWKMGTGKANNASGHARFRFAFGSIRPCSVKACVRNRRRARKRGRFAMRNARPSTRSVSISTRPRSR